MDLGDRVFGKTVDFMFTTRRANGTPVTFAGSPVISVYKNGDTSETTAGVTLTVDFDGRTGLNHVEVNFSDDLAFYAIKKDYVVVITNGTVSGTDLDGTVVAAFSIENRVGSALNGKQIIPNPS